MTQAGFTPAGALFVRSGEAFALPLILQNGAGENQDLLGRSFVLSFRLSRASEPFLSVAGVLADDHFSVSFVASAEDAAAIYEAGLSRALRGDITEVGGTFRHSFPVTVDEGSGVAIEEPLSLPNLPVTELVAMPGATIVVERGAQGYGAERRLYEAGLIDEPTVAAMDERYALAGAPFADAAAASASEAEAQAAAALADAERAEAAAQTALSEALAIRDNGAEIILFNRATTFPKPSIGYEVQQQAETLSQQSLIGFPVGAASGLASMAVPITVSRIATAFYTLLNIRAGGAVYRRCGMDEAALPGDLISQDGARWTLAERCPTPEMFGAIGNGDAAYMMADTYALQYGLNYSAAARVPLYGSPAIYMVDGYKGARESWEPGSTAHGGLIVPDGAVFLGAGIGKTIIRNGAQNWRCVLRVRAGSTSIRHLTIDGNRTNCIPILHGPTNADTGSVRGEGIIYEGGDTAGLTIDLHDVKVMRTGHYGIGVQNVGVKSALIDSIIFEDIGGDCIDVKWYSIPNYDKNLIISRIISDGCGKYFLGLPGEADNGANNANQAVVDVGGKCIVRDIFAIGLDSDENS